MQKQALPTRAIDLLVIHCAATPSGMPLLRGQPGKPGFLNAAQVINAWHAARGFKRQPDAVRGFNPLLPSIGYHYVIDLDGTVLTGRGLDEIGAHALNFNAHSVGICLVGGAEPSAQYTRAQWASLAPLVNRLMTDCAIPGAAPKLISSKAAPHGYYMAGGVCGHRDLSPDTSGDGLIESFEWLKTCPGFDVKAWLANGLEPLPQHVVQDPIHGLVPAVVVDQHPTPVSDGRSSLGRYQTALSLRLAQSSPGSSES